MEKKEMDQFLDNVKSQVQETIENEMKSKSEKIAELESSLKSLTEKGADNEAVKTLVGTLEGKIKALEEGGNSPRKAKSLRELLVEQKDGIAELAKKGGSLTLKAPATMLVSTNITGANSGLLPEIGYIDGLKEVAEKDPSIVDLVNVFPTDSAQITWSDEANKEGDAEFIAEGALKPLIDFEIQPKLSVAKEVAGVYKVGKNMLMDIPYLESLLNTKIRKRIMLKLDEKVFNGDEAGSGGDEFDGITQYASAFVAGSLAGTVPVPNNSDAIRAAITQIEVQSDTDRDFMPNVAWMHPYDVAGMDLQKGSDGHYVLPPFSSADNRTVYGVRVISTTRIPAGNVLVADSTKSNVGIYQDIEIEFGFENDDFRKNLVTLRGSMRAHHFISSNEAVGFVYDSLATIKTAIEKV